MNSNNDTSTTTTSPPTSTPASPACSIPEIVMMQTHDRLLAI